MRTTHAAGRASALAALTTLAEACRALTDERLVAPSRCPGWARCDVLAHLHLGLQDMLLGTLNLVDGQPDTDAATYWRTPPPEAGSGGDPLAGLLFTRRLASAYRRPTGLVAHLLATVDGVARRVAELPEAVVGFQGHVLTTGDFLTTWAVEIAVHHLDLRLAGPPAAAALGAARETVEALLGLRLPADADDAAVVLAGFGRVEPAGSLAGVADLFPAVSF